MEDARRIFVVVYLVTMISYFFSETSGNFKRRALNKILLAFLFLSFSIYGFINNTNIINLWLLIAIFFSFLGDVLLLYNFNYGGMAFILGNICYSVYLLLIYYHKGLLLWPFLILFSLFYGFYLFLLKIKYLNLGNKKIFSLYMASIVAHGCLGLLLTIHCRFTVQAILGIGLTLFMLSDYFLAAHYFHDKGNKWILISNSGCYFTGMMLVALYIGLI
ncbi:MAG: lysoplasmalogenase family protein [Erysipelotrichia bacterium]|nr:lysoplasmalogenase family protein [Erysipelotrichia bacterium]